MTRNRPRASWSGTPAENRNDCVIDNVPSQGTATIHEQQIGKLSRFVIDGCLCRGPDFLPLLNGFPNSAMDRFCVWATCFVGWNFEEAYTVLFRLALRGEIPSDTAAICAG
jgi:hypothetical protein